MNAITKDRPVIELKLQSQISSFFEYLQSRVRRGISDHGIGVGNGLWFGEGLARKGSFLHLLGQLVYHTLEFTINLQKSKHAY